LYFSRIWRGLNAGTVRGEDDSVVVGGRADGRGERGGDVAPAAARGAGVACA
jgi:hypothetical protein